MTYNDLSYRFKEIINKLFSDSDIECKKLFYWGDTYYCSYDILHCIGKNTSGIHHILSKLKPSEKFTIKKLQEYKPDNEINPFNDLNTELILSLNQHEMKQIYVNNIGLYKIIVYCKTPKTIEFSDFIFDIILPFLNRNYENMSSRLENINKIHKDDFRVINHIINKTMKNELQDIELKIDEIYNKLFFDNDIILYRLNLIIKIIIILLILIILLIMF